jgi:hypothetical protein
MENKVIMIWKRPEWEANSISTNVVIFCANRNGFGFRNRKKL